MGHWTLWEVSGVELSWRGGVVSPAWNIRTVWPNEPFVGGVEVTSLAGGGDIARCLPSPSDFDSYLRVCLCVYVFSPSLSLPPVHSKLFFYSEVFQYHLLYKIYNIIPVNHFCVCNLLHVFSFLPLPHPAPPLFPFSLPSSSPPSFLPFIFSRSQPSQSFFSPSYSPLVYLDSIPIGRASPRDQCEEIYRPPK